MDKSNVRRFSPGSPPKAKAKAVFGTGGNVGVWRQISLIFDTGVIYDEISKLGLI